MEDNIGKIVTLPDGRKAKVKVTALDFECRRCACGDYCCTKLREMGVIGYCSSKNRTDGKNIFYKEIKEESK